MFTLLQHLEFTTINCVWSVWYIGLYEQELASARRLLDDISKEKAKLMFENGKLKTELDELHEKFVVFYFIVTLLYL